MEKKSGYRIAMAILLIALLVAVVAVVIEYGQIESMSHEDALLSSSISSLQVRTDLEPVQLVIGHLVKLSSRNVTEVLSDYAPNASMVYSGETMGLGGTYDGLRNITFALNIFVGQSLDNDFSLVEANVTSASNSNAVVTASISFVGFSHIYGDFNGTVSATYSFVNEGGIWLISQEDWVFDQYVTQYSLAG